MSEPVCIGNLPKVARHGDAIHVFPRDGGRVPIAGPFKSADEARWYVVELLEKELTEPQREIWRKAMEHHTPTRDAGLELGVLDMVQHGRTWEQIARYVPRQRHGDRRQQDRRSLAANDRDAA